MGTGSGAGDGLDGRLAVVVGGNQGIGAAIAVGLASAGCDLVLVGRDRDRLARTRERADDAGHGRITTCVADVRSLDDIARLTATVLDGLGVPTVLVNSAGGTVHKAAFDVTVDDWDQLVDTHMRGTFFVCQGFGRAMADAGYGKIINLSSTWAVTVRPGRSVYAAAKAGVSHLTRALATEWGPFGVRVNAIAPGRTLTPRVTALMTSPDEADHAPQVPLGRNATPGDVVGSALFLAGPASDFVTGHTLFVDGGFRSARM